MGLARIVRVEDGWSHLLHRPGNRRLVLWFLHGLGDWSAAWQGALAHPALAGWDLFVPDLPGFGRTPPAAGPPPDLGRLASHVEALVGQASPRARVVLVGHSMGGAIGTLIAERRPGWLAGFVSVEGNLGEDDCSISGRAAAASEFGRWFDRFTDLIYQQAREDRALRHYHAGLLLADRPTFLAASRDLVALSTDGGLGRRYAALEVPRVYFHGTREFPERSLAFLEAAGLDREAFEGAGHWVLGDAGEDGYARLASRVAALEASTP